MHRLNVHTNHVAVSCWQCEPDRVSETAASPSRVADREIRHRVRRCRRRHLLADRAAAVPSRSGMLRRADDLPERAGLRARATGFPAREVAGCACCPC